jgi:putative ABC transport system permease protein
MLRQFGVVTLLGLRDATQRLGASFVVIIGVATVVAVMIATLALGQGARSIISRGVPPGQMIILSAIAPAERLGSISPGAMSALVQAPGLKRDASGRPALQGQALVLVEAQRARGGGAEDVPLRGIDGTTPLNAPLKMIEGRAFQPGTLELMVGRSARAGHVGLNVGERLRLRGSDWTIVGVFDDPTGIYQDTLLGDAATVISAFGRTGYQSGLLQLESPADIAAFQTWLAGRPDLQLTARPHGAYLAEEVRPLVSVMNLVAVVVTAIMAVGTVFSAANVLYSIMEARTREVATLRAIGYRSGPLVCSLFLESALLALPGAIVGIAAALLLLSNRTVSAGQLALPLHVTPELAAGATLFALAIGLVAGAAPVLRAASLPIAVALRRN